ncbi:MAG: hypothetical protein K8W52_12770 [Deltaproteobacteria bacterium]|nr:hypothetical protein [Deltaproteobacteria bacterium]
MIEAAPYVQPWRGALDQTAVDVHAYAPPLTLATALGQVHVWSAGTTTWGSALPRGLDAPRAAAR